MLPRCTQCRKCCLVVQRDSRCYESELSGIKCYLAVQRDSSCYQGVLNVLNGKTYHELVDGDICCYQRVLNVQ